MDTDSCHARQLKEGKKRKANTYPQAHTYATQTSTGQRTIIVRKGAAVATLSHSVQLSAPTFPPASAHTRRGQGQPHHARLPRPACFASLFSSVLLLPLCDERDSRPTHPPFALLLGIKNEHRHDTRIHTQRDKHQHKWAALRCRSRSRSRRTQPVAPLFPSLLSCSFDRRLMRGGEARAGKGRGGGGGSQTGHAKPQGRAPQTQAREKTNKEKDGRRAAGGRR